MCLKCVFFFAGFDNKDKSMEFFKNFSGTSALIFILSLTLTFLFVHHEPDTFTGA